MSNVWKGHYTSMEPKKKKGNAMLENFKSKLQLKEYVSHVQYMDVGHCTPMEQKNAELFYDGFWCVGTCEGR